MQPVEMLWQWIKPAVVTESAAARHSSHRRRAVLSTTVARLAADLLLHGEARETQ